MKKENEKEFITLLSEEYQESVNKFDCLNEDEKFENVKSKKVKKFKAYSKAINEFLKEEALIEQEQGLNTTHLLLKGKDLVGFMSLCTDSIRLEPDEKENDDVPYANIPALKIARLAIDREYQHEGYGEKLMQYAIKCALDVRNIAGTKFLTVDCYQHRLSYYHRLGFVENSIQRENREPDSPLSLRLHIDKYLEALEI